MKTLLAIIAAASLVVGCGVFEEEQTSIDATSGGTTSAPTGGGDSTPTVAAESSATSGRIAAGFEHTCAIKADDSLECWGRMDDGMSTVPVGLGSVKSVAAGGSHTCAIKADDSLECWWAIDYGASTVPVGLGSV